MRSESISMIRSTRKDMGSVTIKSLSRVCDVGYTQICGQYEDAEGEMEPWRWWAISQEDFEKGEYAVEYVHGYIGPGWVFICLDG